MDQYKTVVPNMGNKNPFHDGIQVKLTGVIVHGRKDENKRQSSLAGTEDQFLGFLSWVPEN